VEKVDRESRISVFDRESGFDRMSDEGRPSWVRTSFDRAVAFTDNLGKKVEEEMKSVWRAWRKEGAFSKLALLRVRVLGLVMGVVMAVGLLGCSSDTFVGDDGGPLKDAHAVGFDAGDADAGASESDASDAGAVLDAADGDGFVGPASRRAFISSGKWTANLGGALGADALCQSAATAASLNGKWMAWVSTTTSSPKSRFVHSAVPWKLLDGTVIANDWSDLTSGALEHNMNRDENGALVTWSQGNGVTGMSGIAWTSTYTDGTSMMLHGALYNCSDFTDGSNSGQAYPYAVVGYISYSGTYQGSMWTDAQGGGGWECFSMLSLLCFEQ
jgi:hypothetical protein